MAGYVTIAANLALAFILLLLFKIRRAALIMLFYLLLASSFAFWVNTLKTNRAVYVAGAFSIVIWFAAYFLTKLRYPIKKQLFITLAFCLVILGVYYTAGRASNLSQQVAKQRQLAQKTLNALPFTPYQIGAVPQDYKLWQGFLSNTNNNVYEVDYYPATQQLADTIANPHFSLFEAKQGTVADNLSQDCGQQYTDEAGYKTDTYQYTCQKIGQTTQGNTVYYAITSTISTEFAVTTLNNVTVVLEVPGNIFVPQQTIQLLSSLKPIVSANDFNPYY